MSTASSDGQGERILPDPPDTVLSFTVRGPWAHFRRIEGNIVKQTYRTIPRTTIAGLTAAILGIGRDEYYDLFAPERSAVAIEPVSPLRTIRLPMNTLSTAEEDMTHVPRRGRKLKIGLPDPAKPRQQHNYEVLVDPAYRIDLRMDGEEPNTRLREALDSGESHYVPSLGLSEHLASVTYHGEFDVSSGPIGTVDVDSVVPEYVDSIVPDRDTRYELERWPAFMEAGDGGRKTTGFTSIAYSPDGDALTVRDVETAVVDGRTVLFT